MRELHVPGSLDSWLLIKMSMIRRRKRLLMNPNGKNFYAYSAKLSWV